MMLQILLVLALVALSTLYLIGYVKAQFKQNKGKGCSKCGDH